MDKTSHQLIFGHEYKAVPECEEPECIQSKCSVCNGNPNITELRVLLEILRKLDQLTSSHKGNEINL